MYSLKDLLQITFSEGASDLHITVGVTPTIRVNGKLVKLPGEALTSKDTNEYAREILGNLYEEYEKNSEIDTVYSIDRLGRFRVNVFKQRNSTALAIRAIRLNVLTLDELNYPDLIKGLCANKRGLVLVTGSTGSGKSTTLAAMINEINYTREAHIITLEDPIEFLHKHNSSIVNQREIGTDTKSYAMALKAALREDPDVILVGEMRDLETISLAITAAETGHLVMSTLHTIGAAKTLDRIIDAFPVHQQQQIRMQLSTGLQGIISQQLIPTKNGKRVAALEIMVITPAIRNLIREGKSYQIESAIQTGSKYGMKTMDMSLVELYRNGIITKDVALEFSVDREMISRMISY